MKKKSILFFMLASSCIMAASGQHIYKKECAGCHGKKAEKKALGRSKPIHGMPYKHIVAETHDYAKGTKKSPNIVKNAKKRFLRKYKQDEIEAVARYISNL